MERRVSGKVEVSVPVQAKLMQVRYFQVSLGRFLSVDPAPLPKTDQSQDAEAQSASMQSEEEDEPESSSEATDSQERVSSQERTSVRLRDAQSWNRYAYVGNNPIVRFDPNGRDWIYSQSTGQVSHQDNTTGKTTTLGTGYSGNGQGLNNPAMQNKQNVGPIPQGTYTIGKQQLNVTGTGTQLPGSMRLTPAPSNKMFGRAGFLMHGDNSKRNKSASNGCIVLDRKSRDKIGASSDKKLKVVK